MGRSTHVHATLIFHVVLTGEMERVQALPDERGRVGFGGDYPNEPHPAAVPSGLQLLAREMVQRRHYGGLSTSQLFTDRSRPLFIFYTNTGSSFLSLLNTQYLLRCKMLQRW